MAGLHRTSWLIHRNQGKPLPHGSGCRVADLMQGRRHQFAKRVHRPLQVSRGSAGRSATTITGLKAWASPPAVHCAPAKAAAPAPGPPSATRPSCSSVPTRLIRKGQALIGQGALQTGAETAAIR